MEEDELENQGGGDVKRQTGGIGKDLPTLRNILTTTVFKYPNDMMTITVFKYPNDMMTITIFKYPYDKSSFLIR